MALLQIGSFGFHKQKRCRIYWEFFYHCPRDTSLMITEPLHSTQAGGRRRGNKWMNKAGEKASECRDSLISIHAGSRAQAAERKETPGECSHTALEGCISKMRQQRTEPLENENKSRYTDRYRCNIIADISGWRSPCQNDPVSLIQAMEPPIRSEVLHTFWYLNGDKIKLKNPSVYIKNI